MSFKPGALLRVLRNRRNLTIREVSDKAGISQSLLSQVERNRISPSLDTLLLILEVYGVPPSLFFKDYQAGSRVEIIESGDRQVFKRKGFTYEKLCGASQVRGKHSFNAFFMVLASGQKRGDPTDGHPGRELGIVVEGSARLYYGDEAFRLKKGDSVSFFSWIPHVLENNAKEPFKAYWIVTPADGEDYFGENRSTEKGGRNGKDNRTENF